MQQTVVPKSSQTQRAHLIDKLLVAAVAGLFGFLPVLLQWMSARAAAKSRASRITLLSEELKFLEQWVNLSNVGSHEEQSRERPPVPEAIQIDLANILSEYRSLREQELKGQARPQNVSFVRRALLLFRPSTRLGWLIHSTFYFLTLFGIAVIVSNYNSPTVDPEPGHSGFKSMLLGMLIIFGPVLFLLQRAALRLRKQELLKASPAPPSP